MGGSGPGNSIATSGGCRTWPARFKCQWTSCAFGRYEAGFARGRSRLEVCGPSGPMGGNDADCGSSWQTRVRASLRNKRLHEEHYQFRHLDPLYPFYLDRGSSIVTKEVLCRADPVRREGGPINRFSLPLSRGKDTATRSGGMSMLRKAPNKANCS